MRSLLSDINVLAVLVAGLIHMVVGLVWFARPFFGRAWIQLTGKDLEPDPRWIAAGILGHQVIALALAAVVSLADASTVAGGLGVAVLVWAGFVVTVEVGELIWERIPFRLFLIRCGNHLVALGLASIILAVWR